MPISEIDVTQSCCFYAPPWLFLIWLHACWCLLAVATTASKLSTLSSRLSVSVVKGNGKHCWRTHAEFYALVPKQMLNIVMDACPPSSCTCLEYLKKFPLPNTHPPLLSAFPAKYPCPSPLKKFTKFQQNLAICTRILSKTFGSPPGASSPPWKAYILAICCTMDDRSGRIVKFLKFHTFSHRITNKGTMHKMLWRRKGWSVNACCVAYYSNSSSRPAWTRTWTVYFFSDIFH